MNLEPAPRLPKLPFLVGDAVLLLAAATLAIFSPKPLDTTTVVIVAVLVLLGAALFIFPYIAGYAADSAEAAQREQARVNDQIARLHTANESLARAAAQIKAVEEAVHKAAREAETLPYRMQEKLAEFNEALAAKEDTDRESLESELEELRSGHGEKLRQAAEKIAKATAELAALEAGARQHLAATHEAVAKLDTQLAAALAHLDAKLAGFKESVAQIQFPAPAVAAPAPAPVAQPESAPASTPVEPPPPAPITPAAESVEPAPAAEPAEVSAPAPVATEPVAEPTTPAVTAEPPKPKKPRAPRKPKPEDTLLSMSDTPADSPAAEAPVAPAETIASAAPAAPQEPVLAPEPELAAESPASELAEPSVSASSDIDDASEATSSNNGVESSTSSDGATRLLATAYIGIGNKLFIRGDGPGLSWDKGVPMQFVSIGKWGWFTHDASGPIHCKLYKNDETTAAIGDIVLEAGRHTEVTAVF